MPEDFVYEPHEQRSTTQIHPEIVAGIKQLGFTLEWRTPKFMASLAEHMAHMCRNCWAPVKKSDGGKLRRLSAGLPFNAVIVKGGLQLMARLNEIQKMATKHLKGINHEVVKEIEERPKRGLGVRGGDRISAIRSNKLNKYMAPIFVPDDN